MEKSEKKALALEAREIKREYSERVRAARSECKDSVRSARAEYKAKMADFYERNSESLPKNPPKRPLLEEIGNSVTHGVGALFAPAALVLMLLSSDSGWDIAGAIVYFLGLFIMFSMSCLYHSFRHGGAVKRIFRRFDYSSIYLLIGATFAPILLSYVGGTLGIVYFAVQWAVIITGITFIGVFGPTRLKALHMSLYIILGWSGLMLLPIMFSRGIEFPLYILGGGVVYSVGIIPYALKRGPSHFIWHFFVLVGALVQWLGIYLYIYT